MKNRQGEAILDFLRNVDTYVCSEWEEGKGHIHLCFQQTLLSGGLLCGGGGEW